MDLLKTGEKIVLGQRLLATGASRTLTVRLLAVLALKFQSASAMGKAHPEDRSLDTAFHKYV